MDEELLVMIRKELEESYDEFPHNRCYEAASLVNKILGYAIVESNIVLAPGVFRHHYHNYDPATNKNVDLSADQFKTIKEKILITDPSLGLYIRIASNDYSHI